MSARGEGARRGDSRLHRADGRAAQVLLVALPLLNLVLGVGPGVSQWIVGTSLAWRSEVSLDGPEVAGLARPGVVAFWGGPVTWTLSDPTVVERIAALVPPLATFGLLVVGCRVCWRLVRAALAGEPFAQAMPRRLRQLALTVMAYGVLVPVLHVLAGMVVLWRADVTGAQAWFVDLSTPVAALTIGMLLLVVAECFRIGRRLAQDVDGLV